MITRKLGRSGLDVSVLCLGTMMFGGATDESVAAEIVGSARDAGVNFIDTADVYTDGRSEEITGRLIRADRDFWVLASKVGQGSGLNRRGLSRKWIVEGVEASLRRLGTDRLDILYLHKEDHDTPLAETVLALGDLVRSGKILHFGVSNFRSWRISELCSLCDRFGIGRPVVSQPYYNAMNRMPEVEHLPACGFYGLGVVPYSPLARGVLTGKYDPDAAAARRHARRAQRHANPADGMAARKPAAREGNRGPRAGARHERRAVRASLGAQQSLRHKRHRRAAHVRTMDGLCWRCEAYVHGGGRGADRPARGHRPSLDAGLQRPRLSHRRARAL